MPNKPKRLQTKEYKDNRMRPWYTSSKWQKLRRLYLANHPLCECDDCTKYGLLKTANVVHHKIPHENLYEELFWDENNWQAMNSKCHNRYTMAVEQRVKKVETRKQLV